MPIFEYLCKRCSTHFEELQWANNGGSTKCPECSSEQVERAFSSFEIGTTTKQSAVNSSPPKSYGGCCGNHCGCRNI